MPPLKNDYFSSSIDIKELKSLNVKHIIYVISIFLSEQYQIYTSLASLKNKVFYN